MKNVKLRVSASRRRASRGNVLVETACIFLVFAALLLGIFDFGQFLFIHQALVERTRSVARWGSIHDPTDSTAITNMMLYNQSTAPNEGTSSYFGLSSANVSATTSGSGTDNYRLNLRVSGYTYTSVSPFMAGNYGGAAINVSVPLGLYN